MLFVGVARLVDTLQQLIQVTKVAATTVTKLSITTKRAAQNGDSNMEKPGELK